METGLAQESRKTGHGSTEEGVAVVVNVYQPGLLRGSCQWIVSDVGAWDNQEWEAVQVGRSPGKRVCSPSGSSEKEGQLDPILLLDWPDTGNPTECSPSHLSDLLGGCAALTL